MRLLICTQAVDLNDPILGFFHRWLERLAQKYSHVMVVCLREGAHDLPSNVEVIPLGEKRRILRVFEACAIAFGRRKEYDAVFVHMNQEYVLAVGALWRILRKHVVLWRNHKIGFLSTRVAGKLAHTVCYTSPSAYVANFSNAVQMPTGIDTELFADHGATRGPHSVLFLGRLDEVKNVHVFLEALTKLQEHGVDFQADVYGDPTKGHEAYADDLKKRFAHVPGISFHESVRNDETPAIYNSHAVYVNLTPSGSFDKTIGEACASGCVVVAANEAVRDVLPDRLFVRDVTPEHVAQALRAALELSESERADIVRRLRTHIEREHSLALLMEKLEHTLSIS